jgi:homoserine dehydrogenase
MNGTTNFILSKMESEGADYQDVLQQAQVIVRLSLLVSLECDFHQMLGYAEADPTADVEGYDVQVSAPSTHPRMASFSLSLRLSGIYY